MRFRFGRPAIAGLALLALMVSAPAAFGKSFVVTRTDDPNPGRCKQSNCSLREAISAANKRDGKDTVVLREAKRYELRIKGQDEDLNRTGDLDVKDRLVIRSRGKRLATIDANRNDRVLHVHVDAPTSIIGVRITGGDDPGPPPPPRVAGRRTNTINADGSGISAMSALKVIDSAVTGNIDAVSGGGIFTGAKLVLKGSLVKGNTTAYSTGAGVYVYGATALVTDSVITRNRSANSGGGILVDSAELLMKRTTVSGNTADAAAAGVYLYSATGRIENSTISGNSALDGSGGGISETTSPTTIVNSTISGNRASDGGGGIESSIAGGGIILRSSTVVRNDGDYDNDGSVDGGGGILRAGLGSFTVVNSLIALNVEGDDPSDCKGGFNSLTGNVLTSTAGCVGFAISSGDLLTGTPRVGKLAANGGPTKTVLLKPGSPAIGFAVDVNLPRRDQRGKLRDASPDSGAFER